MVDVFCSSSVSTPFADIVCEEGFVAVVLRPFRKGSEDSSEVAYKVRVKILSKKMC